MFIWLLFFSVATWSDDNVAERYCFNSLSQRNSAVIKIKGIQVPSDMITADENCLNIQMRPHRRELVQRFILSQFPDATIPFSSVDQKREACHLKVDKTQIKKANTLNGEVNSKFSFQATQTEGSGSSSFQIQTIKDFELRSGQDMIIGSCRLITPDRYEISLTVKRSAEELYPGLPSETVIVNPEKPKDEKLMDLRTQLILQRGERIEIGKIVKDLKDKSHEASSLPQITLQEKADLTEETVYLSLQ